MGIQTRALGRTGVPVTVLGYGAMELRGRPPAPELSAADVGRLLNAVLDGGINLIDIAERGPLPADLYEQARRLLPATAARPAEGAGRPED